MRLVGVLTLLLGTALTVAAIVFPILNAFFCVGLAAIALGLLSALTAKRFRAMPIREDDGRVKDQFLRVAEDPTFHVIAGLSEEEQTTLLQDLSTAVYRFSSIQGGYAGRDAEGRVVLGLSRIHLRRAPAAHELFHLARDVVHRSRKRTSGSPLDGNLAPTPPHPRFWNKVVSVLKTGILILREERIVWLQTLSYVPISGTLEVLVPLMLMVILPAWGFYALLHYYCWM